MVTPSINSGRSVFYKLARRADELGKLGGVPVYLVYSSKRRITVVVDQYLQFGSGTGYVGLDRFLKLRRFPYCQDRRVDAEAVLGIAVGNAETADKFGIFAGLSEIRS